MKPEDLQKLVTKVMPFGKHKGTLSFLSFADPLQTSTSRWPEW
ncbi:MAG: DUF3820 family protein [Burkholderiales bacterium]|nr:DUF3820 family protein [Burkholderiales bacterium]